MAEELRALLITCAGGFLKLWSWVHAEALAACVVKSDLHAICRRTHSVGVLDSFRPQKNMHLTVHLLSIVIVAGMIGYGMAKAAVHQLTKSLAAKNGGLPADSTVVAILPWVFSRVLHLYVNTVIIAVFHVHMEQSFLFHDDTSHVSEDKYYW